MAQQLPTLGALVEAATSALIVIDVQNDFCAEGGYFDRTGADLSLVEPAVERIVALTEAARAAGVAVIFVRSHYDPVYLSETQNARRRRLGWEIPLCRQGTWGVELYRVAPRADETIITKHRYDAFYQTDLELVLRTNGIASLLFAGVATNVCVESTLRSAFMRDFNIVLVEDCAAARDRRAHEGTLENVRTHFGLVATSEEIARLWRAPAPARAVG
ncbi:MAG: cysteine hydrolase [Hyphomicrobiales bacterium]|nr:cysteine hydrolase [Hyphomicrobiales bacterium]